MSSGRSAFIRGLVIGAVLVTAAFGLIAPLRDQLPEADEADNRSAEAQELIEDSYFRKIDPEKLENASISGMVKEIKRSSEDRFSNYFDPKTYKRFQASTSGKFTGIGLTVGEVKQGLEIGMVFEDTPAEGADLDVGDKITAVEGKPLAGVGSTEAASRIKGPVGTEVEITVLDAETGKKRTIDVERAEVSIPAVEGRLERRGGTKVAYVQLRGFTRGAHGELRAEIERLQGKGAEGVILDLRENGGGLLDEGVLVTSIFQEEGPVVTIEGRSRAKQTLDAAGGALDVGPTAVLVNENTASASEIVSAALQENDLATIIGTTTFGKGTFQEVIPLEAGGALDLTVGEYLTADGTSILNKGVKPDERVADEDASDGDDVLDAGLREVVDQIRGG